jgi:hypothetical protein
MDSFYGMPKVLCENIRACVEGLQGLYKKIIYSYIFTFSVVTRSIAVLDFIQDEFPYRIPSSLDCLLMQYGDLGTEMSIDWARMYSDREETFTHDEYFGRLTSKRSQPLKQCECWAKRFRCNYMSNAWPVERTQTHYFSTWKEKLIFDIELYMLMYKRNTEDAIQILVARIMRCIDDRYVADADAYHSMLCNVFRGIALEGRR